MKMRLQVQAAQESTLKNSVELSDDDIEVTHFFLFAAYANLVTRK